MIEHESKIFLGGLKGGPKPFPNYTKNFWIQPFSDPPGHLEVFQHPFLACPHGVSPHSDFCANLFICSQDLKFHDGNASLSGVNQILVKTESTIFGHFFNEFCPILWEFLDLLWCLGTQNLWFLKLYMVHNTNFQLCIVQGGKTPQKGIREAQSAYMSSKQLMYVSFYVFVML